jgi:hypothetical protein
MNDRNIVFETQNQVEAKVIQGILESNAVEVFVYQESLGSLYGFYSPSIGMIRLGVHAEDIGKAKEIISSYAAQYDDEHSDAS